MTGRTWLSIDGCRVADLVAVTSAGTSLADYPWAAQVIDDVLLYSAAALRPAMADPVARQVLQDELVRALADGPGVVVLSGAYPDTDVVDAVSGVFDDIIHEQRAATGSAGVHPPAHESVWNALEKLAIRAPDLFIPYYANDVIALVSQAWLGPGYQVTSQVQVVNPGAVAEHGHRDDHLGRQPGDVAQRFPAHAHALSPGIALHGAVAHTDMPVESGPTLYLPHSQKYVSSSLTSQLPEFRAHFAAHGVQLSLFKGDAVFVNPAILRASGANTTRTVRRMANQLQVSSAFARSMESVDRERIVLAIYGDLLAAHGAGDLHQREVDNVVASSAEGYGYPANLDRDPPVDGVVPMTQADLLGKALSQGWSRDVLATRLAEHAARHAAN